MADIQVPEMGEPVQILPSKEFARSGVYFLHLNGEVVYVGQAENMRKRIGTHLAEATKHFDSVSCIACSRRGLLALERYYIAKLAPRYNKCRLSNQVKSFVAAGFTSAPEASGLSLSAEAGIGLKRRHRRR